MRNDKPDGFAVLFILAAIFALLFIGSMLGCSPAEQVTPTKNAARGGSNIPLCFEWRLRSREELATVYLRNGKMLYEGQSVSGFAAEADGKLLVYTQAPQYVDDDVAKTLGHEIMHHAFGDYHSQKEKK